MPQPRDVALFVTCLTDQFYPRVGVAITKILEHFNCRVHFPGAQTCCGQPFFNNGFHDDARALAKRMVEIFAPFEHVVTPSGSCCAMVRQHYRELLGDSAGALSSRTFEFLEFLDRVLQLDLSQLKLPRPRTITYHYSCHLRGLGISDECPRLLSSIGNVSFVPLERADQCCGFGGTFAVKYPVISGSIVQDKANCIAKTHAQTVISNDAGCTMNIAGMCHRQEMDVEVMHVAELLCEALGLGLEGW